MNMSESYLRVVQDLESLKYLLRIQDRHAEADKVSESISIIKDAISLSKHLTLNKYEGNENA